MGEIVEETKENNNKVVEITVKTIGPARPSRLSVSSPIKVHDLRKLIAKGNHLPIENLRLILHGKVLDDRKDEDDVYLRLCDGDSVIAAVKPKPPAKHLRDDTYIDDDDDLDMKFHLPQSTSRWKKKLFFFLRNKLKLPDILLMAIFSLSLKMWAIIFLWFVFAPIAHRWDLGPLYILGTAFSIIFLNLGQRQPGDISAYSIFNDDFQELPGTLNADRLDRDIRAGQF
ncbi:ubiquitin family protein [Melia azedarach]|uniref:Ubiquitin family protein n=1 Tax=Melia azedarach TaxID=155640 RepID=A0ACC1Z031_MELAZ|nr:ubiquitin family protein [Melia azedarach]